jgi:PhzF family phenazine biosynthesis protein
LDDAYLVELTDSFGIKRDQIIAHQWVDNGSGWAVVQLSSAEEVLALEPNLSKIPEAKIGVLGAYAESCKYAFEIRAFAPGSGVSEDPVTGSLNAAVAQWLIRTGVAPASFRVAQGTRLGRAGSVLINTDAEGILWVGGVCTTFIWGKIFA